MTVNEFNICFAGFIVFFYLLELEAIVMGEEREMEDSEKYDLENMAGLQQEHHNTIPPWSKQITARGLFASLVIGVIYSVIVMKLNLTTGLVPTLNVSAALLAFVFLRTWTKILKKAGILSAPFTRQENTVVQTCAVACYSIAVGGWLIFIFGYGLVLGRRCFLIEIW